MLLLNLGGPETLDDVQPFLYNLFADDSIIRLPPYGAPRCTVSGHAGLRTQQSGSHSGSSPAAWPHLVWPLEPGVAFRSANFGAVCWRSQLSAVPAGSRVCAPHVLSAGDMQAAPKAELPVAWVPPAARFLQPVLAAVISTLRAPKSSEGYRRIGGGSPLRRITEEQAAALGEALQQRGLRARVYVGMRYWSPFIDDAVEQVRAGAWLGSRREGAPLAACLGGPPFIDEG